MRAVEFETVSKDGIIQIPKRYHEFASKPLRVVLLLDEPQKQSKTEHLQTLINEGLASGVGKHSMSELKDIGRTQFMSKGSS